MSNPNDGPMNHVRRQVQLPVLEMLRALQADLAETQMVLSSLAARANQNRRNVEILVMSLENGRKQTEEDKE